MELSSLAGNSRLKEQLSRRGEGRGLSHAYILSGPTGSGRHTLARLLAAAMVCSGARTKPCGLCAPCKKVLSGIHPDVTVITGLEAGKPINVGQIRDLRADAHIRPNEGERKIYLLEGADRMRAEAQNAMLKLLEEGPKYAVFLLLAENGGGLLQTVRSRCEELELTPVPLKECVSWLESRFPDRSGREIEQAALDCQGILGRAVETLEGAGEAVRNRNELAARLAEAMETAGESDLFAAAMVLDKYPKEDIGRLLDALETRLVARLAVSQQRRRLMRSVELVRTLREAAAFNVNSGQMAGWLCAGLFI